MKFQTDFGAVFVGNVSSAKLVKTKMAKSTLDAGWSMLKTMLEYKSHRAGVVFKRSMKHFQPRLARVAGAFPLAVRKVGQVWE